MLSPSCFGLRQVSLFEQICTSPHIDLIFKASKNLPQRVSLFTTFVILNGSVDGNLLRKIVCPLLDFPRRSTVDNLLQKIACPLSEFLTKVSKWQSPPLEDSLLTFS